MRRRLWDNLRPRVRGIYHAVTSGGYPLYLQRESYKPFFIVGSGRCGTTLLRRLLQASPEIHIPPENWALAGCIRSFRRCRWLLTWREMVDLLLGRHVLDSDRWFDEPPADLRKQLLKIPNQNRSLARFLDAVYCYHGEQQNATFRRWGDKTPLNINCMDAIVDVFPAAKFIHLVRDGVDVTHSWTKLPKYRNDVKRAAQRWADAVKKAKKFTTRYPERISEVSYESLCQAPEKTLRKICQFIDLSYESNMIARTDHYDNMEEAQSIGHYQNVFKGITTDSIGKGRSTLTRVQKQKIEPIINHHLDHLGYEIIQI